MTDPASLLEQAQALIRDHQPEAARRLLQSVLRCEPANEAAWWCYLQTFERRQDRAAVLTAFAREFPENPRLGRLISKLREPERSARLADTQPVPAAQDGKEKPADTWRRKVLTYLPWAILACVLGCLIVSGLLAYRTYSSLEQRFNILMNQYLILDQSFTDLSLKYKGLLDEFDTLNHTYAALTYDYRSLDEQYQSLKAEHDSLLIEYDQLNLEYGDLEMDFYDLADSYWLLDSQAIKPPYIHTYQRDIVMAFFKDNGQLFYWSFEFDELEEAIKNGEKTRERPDLLRLGTNDGSSFLVEDFRVYVQAEPFRKYLPDLYAASDSDEAFIRQVWGIVTQLTIWTDEPFEKPRYPLETLLAGGGDCEDLSILFASMLKAAPVDWEVDLVYMDSDSYQDPQTSNHVIVYVNTGEYSYFIETTSNQDMTPYPGGVTGWYYPIW